MENKLKVFLDKLISLVYNRRERGWIKMTFEIQSKYEKGNTVSLKNFEEVHIIDIKIQLFDNYFRIYYLVEYYNRERKWIEESSIGG